MIAILYLAVATLTGYVITSFFPALHPDTASGCVTGTPCGNPWVRFAASFAVGILALTWPLYALAFILHKAAGMAQPLGAANAVVLIFAAAAVIFYFLHARKSGGSGFSLKGFLKKDFLSLGADYPKARLIREGIFYAVLMAFIAWTMFYVLNMKNGTINMGYTVFSDYAPHTAMIRSFSLGANYPTRYPHFGGEDIKYHFMFQFLCGNLEYLGLPLVWAYNLPSILGLTGFLMILSQIAVRLFDRISAGVLTAVFFFFRSGTAFFQYIRDGFRDGTFAAAIKENTAFIGYTPNENWGLWNYNVYLNQRHFGFVLILSAFLVWYFLGYLEENVEARGSGGKALASFFAKDTWKAVNIRAAVLAGLFLGLSSFWNGAVVIGTLLILFGMALFSRGKTDYIITAVITVVLSFLQTKFFISGSAVSTSFFWGFISEDKSLKGVLIFLIKVTGIAVLGLIAALPALKKSARALVLPFLLPVVFAFTISLTPDVTVNQKYIMIAFAYAAVLWGGLISRLFCGRTWRDLIAIALVVLLTATGAYDFAMIIRGNGDYRHVSVAPCSDVTLWLSEHTTSEDLVLTPEYSVNEVTISGAMMYCGWPYYAWSAGYDTDTRSMNAADMYSTYTQDFLRFLIESEGIDYIVYEDGFEIEGIPAHEETIAMTYPLVFTSENGYFRIYQVE